MHNESSCNMRQGIIIVSVHMKPYQKIEHELGQQQLSWWDRLVQVIPELTDLSGTPQPRKYHAEGDVAEHTRLAIKGCPSDGDPDLVWAALLHDIGKPLVTKDEGDRISSHGHQVIGAEIAKKILKRLDMPAERRERIVWAIRHHTFHLSWNLQSPKDASKRHKRLVADPNFPLLLELLRVDSAASLRNPRGMKTYKLYKRLREMVEAGD